MHKSTQKRIARAFNKKVKLRNLKERDLVLKVLRSEERRVGKECLE